MAFGRRCRSTDQNSPIHKALTTRHCSSQTPAHTLLVGPGKHHKWHTHTHTFMRPRWRDAPVANSSASTHLFSGRCDIERLHNSVEDGVFEDKWAPADSHTIQHLCSRTLYHLDAHPRKLDSGCTFMQPWQLSCKYVLFPP